MAIQFKVGQTYSGRFMSDYDSIASFTIVKRTAKTVTFSRPNGTLTRRISEYCDVEQFRPFGSYSMAMVIDAKDPDLSVREDTAAFHEFAANVRKSLGE